MLIDVSRPAQTVGSNKACPVCGGELCLSERPYTVEDLFKLWDPIHFSESTIEQHRRQAPATAKHSCVNCKLDIFLPQIIGTPEFYDEAYNLKNSQEQSRFTYSDTKWDFEVALQDVRGSESVMEVGCGPGNFLSLVKPVVTKTVGIEFNETAAELARNKGLTVEVSGRDFDATKFIAQFDCVFSFHVLEHVADPLKFL